MLIYLCGSLDGNGPHRLVYLILGPFYLPPAHFWELETTWVRDLSLHCDNNSFEEYISIFISIYQEIYTQPF